MNLPNSDIVFFSKKKSLTRIFNFFKIHPFASFDNVIIYVEFKKTAKTILDFIDFDDEVIMDNQQEVNHMIIDNIHQEIEEIPIGKKLFIFK